MDNRDAENRLASRGVPADIDCPLCGRNKWMPAIIGDAQDVGVAVFDPQTRRIGGYIDVASFSCENCGFIRLHSLQVLGDPPSPRSADRLIGGH